MKAAIVDPIPAFTSISLSRRCAPKILSAGPCHLAIPNIYLTPHSKKAAPISQSIGTKDPVETRNNVKYPAISWRCSARKCKPVTNELATSDTRRPIPVPVIKVTRTNLQARLRLY